MNPEERDLLAETARISGVDAARVEQLGATMLAVRGDVAPRRRSRLNNDGSALQICETCTPHGRAFRLITDAAADLEALGPRFAAARAALADTLHLAGAEGLAPLCAETLARVVPPNPEGDPDFAPGLIWLAASITAPGVALYVNARSGAEDSRWDRARRWLDALLPHAEVSHNYLDHLRPHAKLASLAVEGIGPTCARAKLYFRLGRPGPLTALGQPGLDHPALAEFLDRVIGDRAIALSGLIGSVGFNLTDGTWTDTKIDLCAHCLPRTAVAWEGVISLTRAAVGVVPPRSLDPMRVGSAELALLGLGIDRSGQPRMNLYLKSPAPRPR